MKYKEDFLKYVKDKIDSTDYQYYYKNGIDLLDGGKLSCAKFVSSILFNFNMINKVHATVNGTIEDLLSFGWTTINISDIKPGDVLVWEKNKQGHEHIGFYIGDNMAISNSTKKKVPAEHHFTYNDRRQILKAFTLIK